MTVSESNSENDSYRKCSIESLNLKETEHKIPHSIALTASANSLPIQSNSQNKRKKNNSNDYVRCNTDESLNQKNKNKSFISVSASFSSDKSGLKTFKSPTSLDNDTLQNMKNLDLNQDFTNSNINSSQNSINSTSSLNSSIYSSQILASKLDDSTIFSSSSLSGSSCNVNINLNDKNSRKSLWNLLKSHSSLDEMLDQFGAILHDKISFWDLVQLKFKHSKKSEIKTTYEIIDDYTQLYSNMSSLLEGIVKEHSTNETQCSRSRSSSRSLRKL